MRRVPDKIWVVIIPLIWAVLAGAFGAVSGVRSIPLSDQNEYSILVLTRQLLFIDDDHEPVRPAPITPPEDETTGIHLTTSTLDVAAPTEIEHPTQWRSQPPRPAPDPGSPPPEGIDTSPD